MAATKGLGTTGNGVGTVTPLDHKLAQSALLAKVGAGSNLIRPGLFYDGVANIVAGRANMAYDVLPFTAALTRGAAAGTVLLTNDGTVTVSTTAAPGSNSRIDIVYVWQREFSLDGTDSNPVIGVVQGTAAASPVAPSLAAFPGAIELARIVVPAGVTATNSGTTITQTAPFTALDGGTLVRRTTAERDGISSPAEGLLCFVLADKVTYRRNASAWRPWESDWITFSPTLTNVVLGTGAATEFRYRYVGGVVEVDFFIRLGTGGSFSGSPTMTLPVNAAPLRYNNMTYDGVASATNAAGNIYPISVLANTTAVGSVWFWTTTSGAYAQVTATVPHTWALNSVLQGKFRYVPA